MNALSPYKPHRGETPLLPNNKWQATLFKHILKRTGLLENVQETSKSTIFVFPQELLCHIFSFLTLKESLPLFFSCNTLRNLLLTQVRNEITRHKLEIEALEAPINRKEAAEKTPKKIKDYLPNKSRLEFCYKRLKESEVHKKNLLDKSLLWTKAMLTQVENLFTGEDSINDTVIAFVDFINHFNNKPFEYYFEELISEFITLLNDKSIENDKKRLLLKEMDRIIQQTQKEKEPYHFFLLNVLNAYTNFDHSNTQKDVVKHCNKMLDEVSQGLKDSQKMQTAFLQGGAAPDLIDVVSLYHYTLHHVSYGAMSDEIIAYCDQALNNPLRIQKKLEKYLIALEKSINIPPHVEMNNIFLQENITVELLVDTFKKIISLKSFYTMFCMYNEDLPDNTESFFDLDANRDFVPSTRGVLWLLEKIKLVSHHSDLPLNSEDSA